ncbi:MAG TPA: hypothetical protein VFV27_01375 [Nevskiaceae bacterium]|nr:hypothetical protein [Nevskiaceae bacterium]
MKVLPALSLTLLLLAGCATVTPYQPLTEGQGYADQKLENNRFRVRFAGNSLTPRETVENYLLFRAAELTLDNGYDYFVFAERDTEADTRYTQTVTGGFGGFGWGWYPRSAVGIGIGTSVPSTEYEAQADILLFKGEKPAEQPGAYDARQLRDNLQALIVRPPLKVQ